MAGIESDQGYFETEDLSVTDRFNELILTGLRTSEGIRLRDLDAVMERPEEFNVEMQNFIEKHWIKKHDDRISLTPEGRLMADHIASSLFILK